MQHPERLLTAAQAAEKLRLSPSRVYAKKNLQAPRRPGKGVRFRADLVEAEASSGPLPARMPGRPSRLDSERGEAASRIFAALRQGKTVCDIVETEKLEPELVADIAGRYAELRGGVALGADDLRAVRAASRVFRCAFDRERRPLVDALLKAIEPPATFCQTCGARDAIVCETCRQLPRKA